jgi:hypothetical protein
LPLSRDHPELTESVEAVLAVHRAECGEGTRDWRDGAATEAWAAEPLDSDVPAEFPTEDFNNGLAPAQDPARSAGWDRSGSCSSWAPGGWARSTWGSIPISGVLSRPR